MTIRDIIGWSLYHAVKPFVKMPDVLSVYFHNPSVGAFERTIKWFVAQGYCFRDVEALCVYVSGSESFDAKFVVVTLDDAWQGNMNLLPIIEKYQIPVTVFAPVEPLISGNYWWEYVSKKGGMSLVRFFKDYDESKFNVECARLRKEIRLERSAMTIGQLKQLSDHPLFCVGAHSYTHPILTRVSDANLEYELKESKHFLEALLDKEVYSFSYPNGSFSEREAEVVRKIYKCAFTVEQDSPRKAGYLYSIPRFALTGDYWSNLAKMIGAWKILTPFIKS